MLYAILSDDVTNSSALRATARQPHLARLKALQEAGRLILAGPHPAIDSVDPGIAGFTGSLVIAEFDSLGQGHHLGQRRPLYGGRCLFKSRR